MEFEILKKTMAGYEMTCDVTVNTEETGETVVSDLLPDILQIARSSGNVLVTGKRAQKDKLFVSGQVICAVAYIPEKDDGVALLRLSVPFDTTVEAKGCDPDACVFTDVKIKKLDARAANPRKVAVRVSLCISCRCYMRKEIEVTCGVNAPESCRLQLLKKRVEANLITGVQTKSFTFGDEFELPSDKARPEDVAGYEVQITGEEHKAIPNKIIVKATMNIHVWYVGGGKINETRFELPFSQVVDMDGIQEDAPCRVNFAVFNADIAAADIAADSSRMLSATVEGEIRIMAFGRTEETVVSDAYSVDCHMKTEQKKCTLAQITGILDRTVQVHETLDVGEPVKSVRSVDVSVLPAAVEQGEGGSILAVSLDVAAVFEQEDSQIQTVSRRLRIESGDIELPEGEAAVEAVCANQSFALAGGGIELRCTVEFHAVFTTGMNCFSLAALEETGKKEPDANKPSITLRYVEPGESFWEIGRRYNTVLDELFRANAMEPTELAGEGRLLLIPRS